LQVTNDVVDVLLVELERAQVELARLRDLLNENGRDEITVMVEMHILQMSVS
jgi:hypothetical protein